MPFLDIGYIFFWVPGVVLFLFGYPLIFSWWSMLVIPITLLIYGLLRRWQERHVFRPLGVLSERDRRGYLGYLFAYQAVTSPPPFEAIGSSCRERRGAGSDRSRCA